MREYDISPQKRTRSHVLERIFKLNQTWQDVETWANANKLPLNQSKTKTLVITGKRLAKKISKENTQLSVVTSEGNTLEQVAPAKLLGLELDSGVCFSSYVDKLCRY